MLENGCLLDETPARAERRERTSLDSLNLAQRQIVVSGAGWLGTKLSELLRRRRFNVVALIDNSPHRQGCRVGGLDVIAPRTAAEKWGGAAVFVVAIHHPVHPGGAAQRAAELTQIGCCCVISWLELSWTVDGLLPHFGAERPSHLLRFEREMRQVETSWSDETSVRIFREQLRWRLWADFSDVSAPTPRQYFPPDLIIPCVEEIFIDGGAYDGDTLRSIPWKPMRSWGIEPDPGNAAKLQSSVPRYTEVKRVLLGATAGWARFEASSTMASARSVSGNLQVEVAKLDDLLREETPTFLKLDVEGDELLALEGAKETLRQHQPVVAVCIYHRPEHFWEIPLWLREHLPNHHLSLRAHAWDGFELVAYAIPQGRRLIS